MEHSRHAKLTLANFAAYASVIAAIDLLSVAYGTVDMVMVAPFGQQFLAAVGQGDVLLATGSALFVGVIDGYSSRLGISEGRGTTHTDFPQLFGALLLLWVPCEIIAAILILLLKPGLLAIGQPSDLVNPVFLYFAIRLAPLPITLLQCWI